MGVGATTPMWARPLREKVEHLPNVRALNMLLLLNIFEDDQHDHSLSVDHLRPMGGHLAWQRRSALLVTCAAEARALRTPKHRDVKGSDAIRLVDASAICWIIASCTRIRGTFPRITNERPRLNGLRLFG